MMKRLFAYNPNLSQSWGLLGLWFVISQLIVSGIILVFFGPNIKSWSGFSAYVLSFIIMGLIVIQLGKAQSPISALTIHGTKATFPLYILLLFLIPLLSVAIEPLYAWIPMPQGIQEFFATRFTNDLATFFLVIIAAPLAEEWLCRGVILKGLLANRMTPYRAIIWSSLIFAVMHLNPWQAIPAFCLGFAMGWVYWRTRSLLPCIFMHAVNNGIAFIMLSIFPDAPFNLSLRDIAGAHYPYIYTGAVALSIAIGYGVWRMVGGKRSDE